MSFIHLHTHSHYSLLDGMSKIPDLVKKAKSYGATALALTDHGNMYGAIEFYKECEKNGIKPIIGCEIYMAERTRKDMESGTDNKSYHLTLLAKNETGYKNLMRIVSRAYLEGFYYKPRADHELLREHGEGIICLSGCPGSKFISLLRQGAEEEAKKLLQFYISVFGKENVFVEIMNHKEVDWYLPLIPKIKALAESLSLPLVATWDSHYLNEDDKEAHNTLLAINTNNNNFKMDGDYSFISPKEIDQIFKDYPEAVKNTEKVAESIDLKLNLGSWYFPNFEIEGGQGADEHLKQLAYAGFEKRGLPQTKEYTDRLEYELEIIKNKGFSKYILIVADLLHYAENNDIYTNIRGSVAGSLTTFLTGVTKVDPIDYKLPFERFLNPERPSAPDIDMDYADDKRDMMLDYVRAKYGEDKVAQIGTFGTMMARGAVRDVARALGYPYSVGDKISKMIPMGSQGFPMTIKHALELVPDLDDAYKNDRNTKFILDMAMKIEGCARHISVHAAGVVISPTPLTDFTPIQLDPKGGKVISQYDMYTIEEAGLIKFDFLGLRNLSILHDAIAIVKKLYDIEVDIEKIPLDDKKTFELLASGQTEALFQLNGSGMTRFLKELKPSSIHDINAMVALYRPGPMQFIPDYIARKHNPSLVKYFDPLLKPILERSYGILVYQDDLLFIAKDIAGYSWGEVDKFRKAVGKKIPEEMDAQHDKFTKGCIEKSGFSKEKAEELWSWIVPFAAYGFNKAHAASYGRVAYQTAYMKANFPVEYMSAALSAESGDIETVTTYIKECERMGIPVLPPDVNESLYPFTAIMGSEGKSEKIRFGLSSIKNLGHDIAEAVIEERKAGGRYTSIENFLDRVHHKNLNKKSLEAMIMSGSMDAFGERGQLVANFEKLLEYNRGVIAGKAQESLFGDMQVGTGLKLDDAPPATKSQKLLWEKELIGLYISGHPLEEKADLIEKTGMTISKVIEIAKHGYPITLIAHVDEVKTIITKKQTRMAFVKISDLTGNIECVIFSDTFQKSGADLEEGVLVAIEGKIAIREGEKSIQVDKIRKI
ncbi:MAG: DNA polymerase III subunit alpha [Candidatus Pacebacteria bacterium]|nr:DNA polymerase III subunit alpha [Candidatus Paceibacterota bacterium]MBP9058300.1 DNA polymerase III subunit alpha [Candidatus Paceibacterota bacterium]MBP9770151.1 DNA polymerase III subunit alpha [Candidatus Paceibacterota bacterium]